MLAIIIQVPIEQVLISAGQEGAAAASGIEDAQLCCLVGRFSLEQYPNRVFHNVIDDIGGRVINAAGFADLGFVFDPRHSAAGQLDDFAQKALVDLPQDIGGQDGKLVGAVGIIEVVDDIAQRFVAELDIQRQVLSGSLARSSLPKWNKPELYLSSASLKRIFNSS